MHFNLPLFYLPLIFVSFLVDASAVEEAFIKPNNQVFYNGRTLSYASNRQEIEEEMITTLFKPAGNAVVASILYKDSEGIKKIIVSRSNKYFAYVVSGAFSGSKNIDIGTRTTQTPGTSIESVAEKIKWIFGPRNLIIENKGTFFLKDNLSSESKSLEYFKKFQDIPSSFKHSEQNFLDDIQFHYEKSNDLSKSYNIVGKVDFVLLSISSTNSACKNCFASLESLINGYQYKDSPSLKQMFLKVYFGDKATIDTPLHIIYRTFNFPSYRTHEITRSRNFNTYNIIDLFYSKIPLFIHTLAEPPITPKNLPESKEEQDDENKKKRRGGGD